MVRQGGLGLYAGRVVSFLTAATVTWCLNRTYTYRDHVTHHRHSEQWLMYLAASVIGAAANYGVYAALVYAVPLANHYPTLAVAAGSLAGMVVNFNLYSRIVFRSSAKIAGESDSA